ncbi:hypothetical protein SpCBS45565_g07819 [Spizellomyces sp. 'palustris']|nr:hypothetical protein SpCBS45565_g07819 [Spizellomyces sp. 'palustris']
MTGATTIPDDDIFAGQIRVLQTMGFPDPDINRRALAKAEGKIYTAIDFIVSGDVNAPETSTAHSSNAFDLSSFDPLSSTPSNTKSATPRSSNPTPKYTPLPPAKQHAIFQLHQMGFKQEGKARHALHKTNWNVEEAVMLLLERDGELDESFDRVGGSGSAPQHRQHTSPFDDLAGLQAGAASPFESDGWKLQPFSSPEARHLGFPTPKPAFSYTPQDQGQPTSHTPAFSYTPTHTPAQTQAPIVDPFADDFSIDSLPPSLTPHPR